MIENLKYVLYSNTRAHTRAFRVKSVDETRVFNP